MMELGPRLENTGAHVDCCSMLSNSSKCPKGSDYSGGPGEQRIWLGLHHVPKTVWELETQRNQREGYDWEMKLHISVTE